MDSKRMTFEEQKIRQLKTEIENLKKKSPYPNFFARSIAHKEREINRLEKEKG